MDGILFLGHISHPDSQNQSITVCYCLLQSCRLHGNSRRSPSKDHLFAPVRSGDGGGPDSLQGAERSYNLLRR